VVERGSQPDRLGEDGGSADVRRHKVRDVVPAHHHAVQAFVAVSVAAHVEALHGLLVFREEAATDKVSLS
jgi:hypothetical protein